MPKTIETVVYRLDELNDAAKEKARAWYREGGFDYDWYDTVFSDFEAICKILGIRLRTRAVRLMGGGSRCDPCLYFSGFWNQGDGACFEGRYAYKAQSCGKIRAYAAQDSELHRIADDLISIQRRNFYQLQAAISHRGRYSHEYSMSVTVDRDSPTAQDMTTDAEDAITESLRDLARWLYRQLEREYEHLSSDDVVDETIAANGYTFNDAGQRFG